MIAKPSIAFNDFAGTAKEVTARNVNGRNVLSVRAKQSKTVTPTQATSRNKLSKISREYKQLSDSQMQAWEILAQHLKGVSCFGKAAEMTGHNAFVRLNINRQLAGEPLLLDAPSRITSVPQVVYSTVSITPELVIFGGITHESSPYKLVVKMSGSQSSGISSGWSKTVIISSDTEDDWGEANLTKLYLKTIGAEPVPGKKVFIESYWMDTSTGFTGQVRKDYVVVTGESSYRKRMRVDDDDLREDAEQHVSSIDVDFSTDSPVVFTDTMCLGHSNIASSYAYLDEALPADLIGLFYVLGRGAGEDGSLHPQSYQVETVNSNDKGQIKFMHRGGRYIKPSEVFGTGTLY